MKIEELPTVVDKLHDGVAELEKAITAVTSDLKALLESLQNSWNVSHENYKALTEAIQTLRNEISELEHKLATLQENKKNEEEYVKSLEADLGTKQNELNELKTKIQKLEQKKSELLGLKEQKEEKIKSLQAKVAELEQSMETAKAQHDQDTRDVREHAEKLREENDLLEARYRALDYLCFKKKYINLHELKIIELIKEGVKTKDQILRSTGIGADVVDRTIESLKKRKVIDVDANGTITVLKSL